MKNLFHKFARAFLAVGGLVVASMAAGGCGSDPQTEHAPSVGPLVDLKPTDEEVCRWNCYREDLPEEYLNNCLNSCSCAYRCEACNPPLRAECQTCQCNNNSWCCRNANGNWDCGAVGTCGGGGGVTGSGDTGSGSGGWGCPAECAECDGEGNCLGG